MIFSRGGGNAGRHTGATNGRRGRHAKGRDPAAGRPDDADLDADPAEEPVDTAMPEFGPYDVLDAPDSDQPLIDLGALRLPAVAGVEVQVQAGPQGQIHQILLAHGASRLQLAVLAAPRTEGIWDEIRAGIRDTLKAGGARPEEVVGEYGVELRARVREGSNSTDVRHVGIDGPRWFVHGVYLGAAAVDPDRAGPLRDVLRGLVVDRGVEARPISEALPLRLPAGAAEQLAAAAQRGSEREDT